MSSPTIHDLSKDSAEYYCRAIAGAVLLGKTEQAISLLSEAICVAKAETDRQQREYNVFGA